MCLPAPEFSLLSPAALVLTGLVVGLSCVGARARAARAWLAAVPVEHTALEAGYRGVDPVDAPGVRVRGQAIAGDEQRLARGLALLACLLMGVFVHGLIVGRAGVLLLGLPLALVGGSCWIAALTLISSSPHYLGIVGLTQWGLGALGLMLGLPGFVAGLLILAAPSLLGMFVLTLTLLVIGICFMTIDELAAAERALRRNLSARGIACR